jgi:hypothetical protein
MSKLYPLAPQSSVPEGFVMSLSRISHDDPLDPERSVIDDQILLLLHLFSENEYTFSTAEIHDTLVEILRDDRPELDDLRHVLRRINREPDISLTLPEGFSMPLRRIFMGVTNPAPGIKMVSGTVKRIWLEDGRRQMPVSHDHHRIEGRRDISRELFRDLRRTVCNNPSHTYDGQLDGDIRVPSVVFA